MSRTKISCFSIGILGLALSAKATIIVTPGHDVMTPNSTKSFAISISDTDNAFTDDIEGLTFTLQIASGLNSTPSISSVDLLTNTVFTGLVTGSITVSSGGNTPQFVSDDLITDNGGEYLGQKKSASGTLATVTFNTTGAAVGDYTLLLVGTLDPGSDSQFTNGTGAPVSAVFNAGTLSIQTTVPEPAGVAMVAAGSLLALRRRHRYALVRK